LIQRGHAMSAQLCASCGELPMASFFRVSTALVLACLLFAPGAEASALREAIKANDAAKVQALLAAGADANEKTLYGGLLNIAAGNSSAEIVAALIAAGADLEKAGLEGTRPMHAAASAGRLDNIKLLLGHGAAVDGRDNSGRTPLIAAVSASAPIEVVALLLESGADPKAQESTYGMSPMSFAGVNNKVDVAQMLVAKGANVDARDGGTLDTPLSHAVYHGRIEIVRYFMEQGADPAAANKDGVTPLQMAQDAKSAEMLAILGKTGAQ
jgi:uncharacterized protein